MQRCVEKRIKKKNPRKPLKVKSVPPPAQGRRLRIPREQENTAIRLPKHTSISSVLNCNYVLVNAVIEQCTGEIPQWTLRLGEVCKDHGGCSTAQGQGMISYILEEADRGWR